MKTILTALLAAVLVLGALSLDYVKSFTGLGTAGAGITEQKSETAYERVMRTGTIRCGYGISEPWFYLEPNTKEIRGLAADVMREIANMLNLQIEWTEETGWGGMVPALNSGRIDVGCSSMWIVSARTREILYSSPYVFNVLNAYTRAGENTLTSLEDINTSSTRISTVDGEVTDEIFKELFPRAKPIALPPGSASAQSFQDIVFNKADVVVYDPFAVRTFNEVSDKKLARIPLDKPIAIWGTGFPVAKSEHNLKHAIDTALFEMIHNGKLKEIIDRYTQGEPHLLYPPKESFSIEP